MFKKDDKILLQTFLYKELTLIDQIAHHTKAQWARDMELFHTQNTLKGS